MSEYALPSDASLLILDDDGPFRTRLAVSYTHLTLPTKA